jgi:hypothetical protein
MEYFDGFVAKVMSKTLRKTYYGMTTSVRHCRILRTQVLLEHKEEIK